MSKEDRVTEALRSRADSGRDASGAWEAIDQGRQQRRHVVRRRQVVVGVVAVLAVIGSAAAVLAFRGNDGDGEQVVTTTPEPAPPDLTPSETTVVAATADGRLVEFDLREPEQQVVLWTAPQDRQIAEVAVDQTRGDIYATLLPSGDGADEPDFCAPEIVHLVEGEDGYKTEPLANGSRPAIIDGRVAFFAFKGGCPISFGGTDWPSLYGSKEVGVIEPGVDWSRDLSDMTLEPGPPPDLAWSPDGQLALQAGGSLMFIGIADTLDALGPSGQAGTTTYYSAPAFRGETLYLAASTDNADSPWLTEWTQASGVAPYVQTNPSIAPLRGWARNLDTSSTVRYVLWTGTPGERPRGGYGPEDYRLSWLDRDTSKITELDDAFVDAAFASPTFNGDQTVQDPESTGSTTSTTGCLEKHAPPPDTPESDPEGAPLRVVLRGPGVPGTLIPFTFEKSPVTDESVLASPHFGLEQLTSEGWRERYTLVDVDGETPTYLPSPAVVTYRLTDAGSGVLPVPAELQPGWYRLTTSVVVTDAAGATRRYTVYTLLDLNDC